MPEIDPPNWQAVPPEIREARVWVLWHYEERSGRWTKVPYQPDRQRRAASDNPDTWTTLDEAAAALRPGWGLGIMFRPEDDIMGVDIDHGRDPDTGELFDEARDIVETLNSYTEVSPSGKGIHVLICASLAELHGRRRGRVEMYESGRFFTFTGDVVEIGGAGMSFGIEPRQVQVEAVHARYIDLTERQKAPRSAPRGVAVRHDDREVLEAMWRSKNGDAVRSLWEGRPLLWGEGNRYPSQSEADEALASHLAWWTNYDRVQTDRLFRASGLMRSKWDEPRGATTYGAMTLDVAFARHEPGDGYTGRGPLVGSRESLGGGGRSGANPTAAHQSTREADRALVDYADTDAGNAERFVHQVGGRVRYVPGLGWHLWTGTHWQPDPSELVQQHAIDTLRSTGAAAELHAEGNRRRDLRKHVLTSESLPRLRAMVELARTDARIHTLVDALDAEAWMLNVENGMLDLRTGRLHPHDRNALFTRVAPVRFEPDAEHPALHALLDVLGQDDRAEYLRSVAGQALTGRGAKRAYVWTGPSGTVKSTTADALAAVLGAYAVSVEPSTLVVGRHGEVAGRARADLIALRGRRFVVSAELPNGGRLDSELVKRITGQDPITARAPYARTGVTFTPGHTLVMHSNHEPQVDWSDDGMRKRLVTVPFAVKPSNPVKRVRMQLKHDADARAAVLAWAVVGSMAWHRAGEQDPEAPEIVRQRTAKFWREQDPFAPWAEERLDFDGDSFTPTEDLGRNYQDWAYENGEHRQSTKSLGRWLQANSHRYGIEKVRHGKAGTRGWKGVRIRKEMG
ncbi:MAG: phage/plasmid primase, P4 family [Trueperaceae bacterium]|nr:phage/plasmid primase, P4 family [Trueperaceae bacterium]